MWRAVPAVVAVVLIPTVTFSQTTVFAPAPGATTFLQGGLPPRDTSAPPATGTSRIRGRIVAADTGQPIRKAIIRLIAPELRENRTTSTDAQGRYEFKDLPAGRYNLNASKGSFVELSYGQTRPLQPGKPVQVGENQTLDRIDVALPRGSVITGRVLDEFGDPVADVQVVPLRSQYTPSGRRPVPAGRIGMTNDIGEFRLFSLAPGQYYVSATLGNMRGPFGGSDDRTGYAATYYPGTPNLAEAQTVTVGLGEVLTDVTLTLIPTLTARITGVVFDAEGKPVGQGNVMVMQRTNAMMFGSNGGQIRPDGTFAVSGLAPGEYVLRAMIGMPTPGMMPAMATATVTVAAADVDGIRLEPRPAVTVTGRLVVDPAVASLLKPEMFRILGMPKDQGDMMRMPPSQPKPVNPDGTFESAVFPGPVIFRTGAGQPGWMVKAVRLNGFDITDTGTDIRSGEEITGLEVEVTNRIPEISGGVTNNKNEKVSDYSAIVFPQDREMWSRGLGGRTTMVRPDQDGRFKVRSLRPGDYYLAAVEYVEQGQWTDPEYLETLRVRATRFTIAEGETKTIDLKLHSER